MLEDHTTQRKRSVGYSTVIQECDNLIVELSKPFATVLDELIQEFVMSEYGCHDGIYQARYRAVLANPPH